MKSKTTLRLAALIAGGILMLTACSSKQEKNAQITPGEQSSIEYLCQELRDSADVLIKKGEDVDDIYTEFTWKSQADTFPAKFDLRERGVVTPVRNQSPYGTCWSFATMGASEASLLSTMGMNQEEYEKKYGKKMDLSEKHLAWFTATALPDREAYGEGEYPYDVSQAGEGLHQIPESDKSIYDNGGNYNMSVSSLASGIGVAQESEFPYESAQGTLDKDDDWSIPEENRFIQSFELKNANVLPAVAHILEDGSYQYRAEATEAIKSELLQGRAVGISFKADQSMPEQSIDEKRELMKAMLENVNDVDPDLLNEYIEIRIGAEDIKTLSDEKLDTMIRLRCHINDLPEDTYNLKEMDRATKEKVLVASAFGYPLDQLLELEKELSKTYMSFVGKDPVIFAQYTDEPQKANHAVTVVGWDDTFSRNNFRKGHRPPGDGVWIVKNSWGTEWGTDGYFYLSYYDQSLGGIQSFEFEDPSKTEGIKSYSILEHDMMPAEMISSVLYDKPVYCANVFEVEMDSVLEHISVMTGDVDTSVTAYIYLLDDPKAGLSDGKLLDTVTQVFRFAGYHRMDLSTNFALKKGQKIGIALLERVPGKDGEKYALVSTSSIGEKGMKEYNDKYAQGMDLQRYCIGLVGPGQSYVSFEEGRWIDWSEIVKTISESSEECSWMAYDNLPIKCYTYPLEDVEKAHDLSEKVNKNGNEAAICPECGFVVEYTDH